jgi:hypothetical protein
MGGGSPRFRRDLTASPVEADGVVYVDVSDSTSGNGFRFYDFEHTVALAMDGRPLDEVADDLRLRCELDLTPEQLTAFAEQLAALGFLEPELGAAPAGATAARASTESADRGAATAAALPASVEPGAGNAPLATGAVADSAAPFPQIFPPLEADESGDFSRPIFASKPAAKSAVKPTVKDDLSDLPEAVAELGAGAAAKPADEGPGLTGPRMDRTLTTFPPEVRPVDASRTPAPVAAKAPAAAPAPVKPAAPADRTPAPVAVKAPAPAAPAPSPALAKTPGPAQRTPGPTALPPSAADKTPPLVTAKPPAPTGKTPSPVSPFRDAKTPPPFTPRPEPRAGGATGPAPMSAAAPAPTKPLAVPHSDRGEFPDFPDLSNLPDMPGFVPPSPDAITTIGSSVPDWTPAPVPIASPMPSPPSSPAPAAATAPPGPTTAATTAPASRTPVPDGTAPPAPAAPATTATPSFATTPGFATTPLPAFLSSAPTANGAPLSGAAAPSSAPAPGAPATAPGAPGLAARAAEAGEGAALDLDIFSPDFGNDDRPETTSDQTLADFKDPAHPLGRVTPGKAAAAPTAAVETGTAQAKPVAAGTNPVAATGGGDGPSEAVTPRATQPPERTEHPTQRLRAVPADLDEAPAGAAAVGQGTRTASGELSAVPAAAASGASAPAPASTPRFATPPGENAVSGRRAWVAYGLLSIAAAVVISFMAYRFFESTEPTAVAVSTMVPAPRTIYRYWDATAKVELAKATPFSFATDGKVAEIVPVGTRFGAGDVLAMLESGKKFNADLTRARERLLHYEGMRDKMTAAGNKPELRQAELKILEKKRLIAEAQASLAKHSLIAAEPGEVAEVLVAVGGEVKAGDPVLRTKGTAFSAVFELPKDDADKARQLGFCRIEIEGKPLECSLAPSGGDETHVAIELPTDLAVAPGKTVKLARNRLDAVFSIPTSALMRVGDTDRLFVVGPSGRAELRVVAVADRAANDAIVTQGIDVGDRVIVAPPPGLRPDTKVLLERAP